MKLALLDDIAWHALTGPHAHCSTGSDSARRYAPGFPPIIAFADRERPDFAALRPYCEPSERLYCAGWTGLVSPGWVLAAQTTMHKMVWDAPVPTLAPASRRPAEVVRLGAEHVPQMLELVALTHPGPFGPRTVELGDFFGIFEGQRLVAMAGERMRAATLREISAVCTHPDYQGRGLARRLIQTLLRCQLERGETPFLHVVHENTVARRIYEAMGFRDHSVVSIRVLTCAP